MVISEIAAAEVVKGSRQALGLPASAGDAIDGALLAALLRRAAGMLCPCSRTTLAATVLESLQYLSENSIQLEDSVEAAVEGLIVTGDLLELNQVTIDDPTVKGTWVFAAPPAFVVRPSGSVFLMGIVPDEPSPLPASLSSRVIHEGYCRIIPSQLSENLPAILRDLGLLELSERVWLRTPKEESANDFHDGMSRRLMAQPPSGHVDDLLILDPVRSVDYYVGRWIAPKNETGNFVARRPQTYGAPIWGFAMLVGGMLTKFLDFPLRGMRWRGCDVAWQLQMAIDHCRGAPQQYRSRPTSNGVYLDFFSPLPLWAERRLAIFGRPAQRHKCLFSYYLPESELAFEEEYLQRCLWLARNDNSA